MVQLNPYLTFNGNCREAMLFYQQCLGGELLMQSVGESPLSDQLPESMKAFILHSTLTKNSMMLGASDMVEEQGLVKGNDFSILLSCSSEDEIKRYYERLSEGGNATHPIQKTYWGTLFGGLTDKFGNRWLFSYQN